MVKVAAPCLSMHASGSIAGALTYATWKGRPYVRQLVKPSNPRSAKQTGVRAMFKFLSQNWEGSVLTAEKATWGDLAAAAVVSPFNAFMGENMSMWRSFRGASRAYPATRDDDSPVLFDFTLAAGIRLATIDITYTNVKDAWGVVLHRSVDTGFAPTMATVVAIFLFNASSPTVYVDTPLAAGTYYYRPAYITIAGKMPGASAEKSVVVTDV